MGHYCVIKFSAKLSDMGVEVIDYLQIYSILEAAKEFPQYPFLEAFTNRFDLTIFPITLFYKLDKLLKVNWEHKIKNYDSAIRFILPYLIAEPVEFVYATEHGDWKERSILLDMIEPKIDWDRNFGDPTGIEIK
jgi:hypothetical protein